MTDRGLFIATMRKPEMRVLRAALYDLRWERGIDWRDITALAIYPPHNEVDSWFMVTDHYQQICLWPDRTPLDFLLVRIHDSDCDVCHHKQAQSANA